MFELPTCSVCSLRSFLIASGISGGKATGRRKVWYGEEKAEERRPRERDRRRVSLTSPLSPSSPHLHQAKKATKKPKYCSRGWKARRQEKRKSASSPRESKEICSHVPPGGS